MWTRARRNQVAVWAFLIILVLPGLNSLVWLSNRFRLGDWIGFDALSGDSLITLAVRLGPTLDRDIALLKLPDIVPLAVAFFLVRLLPHNRSTILKFGSLSICVFGYFVYLLISTHLTGNAQVTVETLLESELFSEIDPVEARKIKVQASMEFLIGLVDGLRYVFLIAGGAFLGLKIENLEAVEKK